MSLTPYAAHTLVNEVLTAAELPTIRPQMMYNYTSGRTNKGKAPLIEYNADTNEVDVEDLKRWTNEYLVKKGAMVPVTPPKDTVELQSASRG
jgi:hypothetical protein